MAGSLPLRRWREVTEVFKHCLPSLGEVAKNDNALLVCFLGTFSASLCKLNRAQMSNEGFGGFPFSIAAVKVLFFAAIQPAASHNG